MWWDQAQAAGAFQRLPRVRLYVNQVGYDAGSPKRFVVATNFQGDSIEFELIGQDGNTALTAPVPRAGRIASNGKDWGEYYAQAAFDEFDTPGTYHIRVRTHNITAESAPFGIDYDLLWNKTPARRTRGFPRPALRHGRAGFPRALPPRRYRRRRLAGGRLA